MSGVSGAYSTVDKDVADTGLLTTSYSFNRGEVGGGMAVGRDDILEPHKKEGNFSVIMQDVIEYFRALEPYVAVGHTRFGRNRGLQPNRIDTGGRYKSALVMDGIIMDRSEEVTLKKLHDWLEHTKDINYAAQGFMDEFYGRGMYSIVWGIYDKKTGDLYLVGLRDPFGIKPFWKGKKNDTFLLSSETTGIRGARGWPTGIVAPGSVVIFYGDKETSELVKAAPFHAHCFFEALYFSRPNSWYENSGKSCYRIRFNIGKRWAELYPDMDADFYIGSPESGIPFWSGVLTGRNEMMINEKFRQGVPVRPEDLKLPLHLIGKNPGAPRTFQLDPDEREIRTAMKFDFNDDILAYGIDDGSSGRFNNMGRKKRVLVKDDSMVKGTVTDSTFEPIEECGAEVAGFGSSCDALVSNCMEDLFDPKPRVAHGLWDKSTEEKNRIVSDQIGYPIRYTPTGVILEEINLDDLCAACLTRRYPVFKEYLPVDYISLLN